MRSHLKERSTGCKSENPLLMETTLKPFHQQFFFGFLWQKDHLVSPHSNLVNTKTEIRKLHAKKLYLTSTNIFRAVTKFLQLHLDVLQTTFLVDVVTTCATLYVGVITINRERFDASHEGGILKIFTGYFPNKCQTYAFLRPLKLTSMWGGNGWMQFRVNIF